MRRVLGLLALVLLGCGGETDLIRDSSFDLWCGDKLCVWSVDQGSATSVPTWHASDRGVLLDGDPVVLSQSVPSDSLMSCLHVYVTGDIPEGTNVVASFVIDGAYERKLNLGWMHWDERHAQVTSPSYYAPAVGRPLHVEMRKVGPGRVVIAQLRVTTGWCN